MEKNKRSHENTSHIFFYECSIKIGDCVHISLDILTMVDPYEVTEKEILKRKYGDMGKSNFLVQACIHTMAEISTKVG